MTPPKTPRTKRALLGALLTFGLIQLVPYGRDHENPPMGAEPAWDSPRTRELFMTACGDCHSHAAAHLYHHTDTRTDGNTDHCHCDSCYRRLQWRYAD